ncbi:MAG TPA: 16S rRNA (guanine(966)-N(2))-methyltransferase RsmD [Anaeromyxobacteraceae bacterium]|nr:16S rRNA (guanine(966)-N(2))-methyltransferase RsmD [Anaeromyxobacteraceae bacterium]
MRIVAGSARGRVLSAPRGTRTRPTSDKVRAAVFNLLGQFFEGGHVLDLYAGSGALSLEALSRGCARALCVEEDRAAAEVIARNARSCGFSDRVEVRHARVEDVVPRLPGAKFALAFLDPPYAMGPEEALHLVPPLLEGGGRVVAEHDRRRPPPERFGPLVILERRTYGETGISIYRLE